jgi:hypothetical protein
VRVRVRLGCGNEKPVFKKELELELIQAHMAQKSMLRVEVCSDVAMKSQSMKKVEAQTALIHVAATDAHAAAACPVKMAT